jgi:hypothetical protein
MELIYRSWLEKRDAEVVAKKFFPYVAHERKQEIASGAEFSDEEIDKLWRVILDLRACCSVAQAFEELRRMCQEQG